MKEIEIHNSQLQQKIKCPMSAHCNEYISGIAILFLLVILITIVQRGQGHIVLEIVYMNRKAGHLCSREFIT